MGKLRIAVSAIELDTSIQCRAQIDTATVNEYAERMTEGDTFPSIIVFGATDRCWIGDGWHRVLAARQISLRKIDADLRRGNRTDALKHALNANAVHGMRRTNADKRRCVEIALREFPKLSSRAIAEMCGVSNMLVDSARPQVKESFTSSRTGADGKQYRAGRESLNPPEASEDETTEAPAQNDPPPPLGPPSRGMQYARIAVMNLEQIPPDDVEREQAFAHVKGWLEDHGT